MRTHDWTKVPEHSRYGMFQTREHRTQLALEEACDRLNAIDAALSGRMYGYGDLSEGEAWGQVECALGARPPRCPDCGPARREHLMARSTVFTLPFKPKTKERPRMTRRGRAYTPKATTDAEDAIAGWIDKNKKRTKPFTGAISVTMRFRNDHIRVEVKERSRTSKLRGDVDNYAKLVLDALQKSHLMADDKQVVHIEATKEHYHER